MALQRSSKQILKMVMTSAQLTSKTFSTFLKSIGISEHGNGQAYKIKRTKPSGLEKVCHLLKASLAWGVVKFHQCQLTYL